jgi:ubiquinone/menaquinone biosynthesis C-methylase UbiE
MSDELIDEMNRYYQARAPWHDQYMSYQDTDTMKKLLEPVVGRVVGHLKGRDVLEVACGTGNWTVILAGAARSVLALDVSEAMVELSFGKLASLSNVKLAVGDAYSLGGIAKAHTAAFAGDWFSHIPRSRISRFLEVLHSKLLPGARVAFVDMLWQEHPELRIDRTDAEGNTICRRRLPDGQEFDVVKNYPTEEELRRHLGNAATDIQYIEDAELHRWTLLYALKG